MNKSIKEVLFTDNGKWAREWWADETYYWTKYILSMMALLEIMIVFCLRLSLSLWILRGNYHRILQRAIETIKLRSKKKQSN
ncbi:hypothetical protein [Helicobacter pylori]|uniref:hypothetical protein n=1 Tax=Helicobacter pylori TaxID=210 RepID=UPI001FF205D9|nr:hypothetical protein [Helicobacter pylori]MCK0500230.1 hypothetical protein [Helicobacter pylori]